MVLVVWHHFVSGAYKDITGWAIDALASFRLPLFFFVSGFFAWKAADRWTSGRCRDIIGRKVRTQICGMFVFYVLWQWRCGEGLLDFTRDGFVWYWFTVALFQMFMVYMALVWLARRRGDERVVWVGLAVVTAVTLVALAVVGNIPLSQNRVCRILSWQKICNYFQFFVLGLAVRRWWPMAQAVMSRRWSLWMALGLFVVLFAVCQTEGFKERAHLLFQILHDLLLRYAGLAAIVMAFYRMRGDLDGNGRITRGMRFMGRRTLDIYFLHYFFLPMPFTMPAVVAWFQTLAMGSTSLAIAIGLVVSVGVSVLCMAVGSVIRRSRVLGMWLFGARG